MESCIFCKISARMLPAKVIHEDGRVVAFHDIHPQAPVHVLICPREHIPTLNDMSEEHGPLLSHMFQIARNIAEQFGIHKTGYRTVFNVNGDGGQTVFHLHLHVIGGRRLTWP